MRFEGGHEYVIVTRAWQRRSAAGDVQCVVDGQLVAIWTGPEHFGPGVTPQL